ncbi:hypothetical protein [Euzebya sp.]|uniref:hypothetical protein n=1 Tax=Euzebya sp. TaxID=1971409 RepID=UPI0035124BCF
MTASSRGGRQLSADGRSALVAVGVGAAVTVGALVVAGLVIGVVAVVGSPGAVRLVSLLLMALVPAAGVLVASRIAARAVGHGVPAAAVGFVGPMAVVVVIALLGLLADDTAASTAVASPVVGTLLAAAVAALRRPDRTPA